MAATAAALTVLGVASACGDDAPAGKATASPSAEPTSGSAPADPEEYPFDVTDAGVDLLGSTKRSVVFPGTDIEVTWRYPESYELSDPSNPEQATSEDSEGAYDIGVVAKENTDRASAVEEAVEESDSPELVSTYDQRSTIAGSRWSRRTDPPRTSACAASSIRRRGSR